MIIFNICNIRAQLLVPSAGAVTVLLHTLKQCLAAEPEVVAGPPGQPSLTEQLLVVLEAILVEACVMPASDYAELVSHALITASTS